MTHLSTQPFVSRSIREETVEILIEADSEMRAKERRRFALINIPRHLFSKATATAARRATNPRAASAKAGF